MEPIESSETSAYINTLTPGTYPKEKKLQLAGGWRKLRYWGGFMIRYGQQMLSVVNARKMKLREGIWNLGGEKRKPRRGFLVKSERKR